MLILFVIVFSLLIFPIFINIGFAIRKTNNIFRIYFYLNIFGLINILSGFAETKKEGIFIHYKNDKAKLLIGLGKGKKNYDKRQSLKEKDMLKESRQNLR